MAIGNLQRVLAMAKSTRNDNRREVIRSGNRELASGWGTAIGN